MLQTTTPSISTGKAMAAKSRESERMPAKSRIGSGAPATSRHGIIPRTRSHSKVNGRIAPLHRELKNGDTVEVLTGPTPRPSRDWLAHVKTARQVIDLHRTLSGLMNG